MTFVGDAAEFYETVRNAPDVADLWETLLYLSRDPTVDFEKIWELPTEDDLLKIIYGPPWTVVFKNLLNGRFDRLLDHPSRLLVRTSSDLRAIQQKRSEGGEIEVSVYNGVSALCPSAVTG